MKRLYLGVYLMILGCLAGCMPLSSEHVNHYQLTAVGQVSPVKTSRHLSLLVMQPSALDGYDTEEMLYVNHPNQIGVFANNAWVSPPATMLLPLMVQSLSSSQYFYAVASDPNLSSTDYRLESQLIRLQQNFLVKPSQVELVMQVQLIHGGDHRVVATAIMSEFATCRADTPLGGVMAANQAVQKLTRKITHFVIRHLKTS